MGHLMLDLQGLALNPEEREILQHPQVGGVILFQRNYDTPQQLSELVHAIRSATSEYCLIAVDQEGGRVQRFQQDFTRLPPMRALGHYHETDPEAAQHLAETTGWLMAMELLAHQVDFSFAPVLDVDTGASSVIGNRSFHHHPHTVGVLAERFCQGMSRAGMASVGKHFPGHGAVREDSHTELPVDPRSLHEITQHDLTPFECLIRKQLHAIMPAHVVYPQIDDRPAGFSPIWLKTILRQQLGFEGVIFSDDLSMEGASGIGDFTERARTALEAGCDMVLVCNHRAGAIQVLDTLGDKQHRPSIERLTRMRGRFEVSRTALQQQTAWQQAVKQIERLIQ